MSTEKETVMSVENLSDSYPRVVVTDELGGNVITGGYVELAGRVSGFIARGDCPELKDCIFVPGLTRVNSLKILSPTTVKCDNLIGVSGIKDDGKLSAVFVKITGSTVEFLEAEIDPKLECILSFAEFPLKKMILVMGIGKLEGGTEFSIIDRLIFDEAKGKYISTTAIVLTQPSGIPIQGLILTALAYEDSVFVGGGIYFENVVVSLVIKFDSDFRMKEQSIVAADGIPSLVVKGFALSDSAIPVLIVTYLATRDNKVGTITRVFDLNLVEIDTDTNPTVH